jgi:hypothetical protein
VGILEQTWNFLEDRDLHCRYVDLRYESQGAVLSLESADEEEWNRLAKDTMPAFISPSMPETFSNAERG